MTNRELEERAKTVLVGNYKPQPIAIVRGEGCYVYDADGQRFLDMIAGIATVGLGHCHPRLVEVLKDQAERLWHTSNVVHSAPQVDLAERICKNSFAERVFFCNSGAEANEAALKMARRWHWTQGNDRHEILSFERSFHGRSLFTVTATGQPKYWEGFEPMVPGVVHARFNDLDSVEEKLSPKTAAIFVEPVQAEGGVRPATREFLQGLRSIADREGILLIFDEVQTGMGRTARLFGHQHYGVEPDAMTLAKALGNGIPVGAMCTRARFAEALVPGTHASTFGGNPLATRCAAEVFDLLLGGGILENASARASHLQKRLEEMASRVGTERVVEVRGLGLLWGVELPRPAAPVIARCRELGVIVNAAGANVVRLAPPLVIEDSQIDEGVATLERAILETA